MLRPTVGLSAYRIPATNPFVNNLLYREIWPRRGNPWRFSFDKATGDMWTPTSAKVGPRGEPAAGVKPRRRNYGWNVMEGLRLRAGMHTDVLRPPRYASGDVSITGGYTYRGSISPSRGLYIYGDYAGGRLDAESGKRRLGQSLLMRPASFISTFDRTARRGVRGNGAPVRFRGSK
jgi:hypothetical protein